MPGLPGLVCDVVSRVMTLDTHRDMNLLGGEFAGRIRGLSIRRQSSG
jgi:hypothetical protein